MNLILFFLELIKTNVPGAKAEKTTTLACNEAPRNQVMYSKPVSNLQTESW